MIEINKVAYDFYNLQVEISQSGQTFGVVGPGCEGADYNWKLNDEVMYGGSRLPVDETDGDVTFDGKFKFNRYWFNFLVAQAAELQIGLVQLRLNLALSYSKGNSPIVTDTLTEVRILGGDHSNQRGPTPLVVELPMRPRNIFYNGVDVFGNRLT